MTSPHWVKISETIEEISFGDNNITQISADGKTICLARHQDQYYAFPQKCPHASGPLVEGYIDAMGNIVCPLPRYRFCLSNGRNVSGPPPRPLDVFDVHVRGDEIVVSRKREA